MLGHIGEAEAVEAQQARGDLRVEQRVGRQRELGESGKVLLCIVQDPCGVADGAVEHAPVHAERIERHRVEQSDAGAIAFELDEPIVVAVAVSRRAFGVGREWPLRRGQPVAVVFEAFQGVGHLRNAFPGFPQQHGLVVHARSPCWCIGLVTDKSCNHSTTVHGIGPGRATGRTAV